MYSYPVALIKAIVLKLNNLDSSKMSDLKKNLLKIKEAIWCLSSVSLLKTLFHISFSLFPLYLLSLTERMPSPAPDTIPNMPLTPCFHQEPLLAALRQPVLTSILNLEWFSWSLFSLSVTMLTSPVFKKTTTTFQAYWSHLYLSPFRSGICMYQWTESAPNTFLPPYLPQSPIGWDSADHQCLWNWSLLRCPFQISDLCISFAYYCLYPSKMWAKWISKLKRKFRIIYFCQV